MFYIIPEPGAFGFISSTLGLKSVRKGKMLYCTNILVKYINSKYFQIYIYIYIYI